MTPERMKNFFTKLIRRWFPRKPAAPSTGKLLVILSDGRCTLARTEDEAQGVVMRECLTSGGVVSATFRPATPDEVAAFEALSRDPL